jgi:hypothetical protein
MDNFIMTDKKMQFTLARGMHWTIPTDMPETGIRICLNGEWRTVTKDELRAILATGSGMIEVQPGLR